MKLVDNWRSSWKWLSIHAMALGGIVQAAWLSIPDGIKMRFSEKEVHLLGAFLFGAGIVGRLLDQTKDAP